MKLHLGSGGNLLRGWLNIDAWAVRAAPGQRFLQHDLSKGLPSSIKPGTVDFIFSEHFLEHLTREQALVLMRSCHQALRKGGVIRIVVPDLDHLITKYLANDIYWGGPGGWQPRNRCVMLNEGVRAWGHSFMYNREELEILMKEAGFTKILHPLYRLSEFEELRALEVRPENSDLRMEAVKA